MHRSLQIGVLACRVAAFVFLAGCAGNSGSVASSVPNGGAGSESIERSTRKFGAVTPMNSLTTLHSFKGGSDGAYPEGRLINVNGTLYGTTYGGGANGTLFGTIANGSKCKDNGCGTVYSILTTGKETVLYSFLGGTNGQQPAVALIDVNGALYGTTSEGGANGHGTVFTVSTAGVQTVLYSFRGGSDGEEPYTGLTDVNGTLFGTTFYGGKRGPGCASGCGTVFSISETGDERVLHRFAGGSDGALPEAGLTDVNGTLYGTTFISGAHNNGTVYSIRTSMSAAKVDTLHSFAGGSDGALPKAGLIDVDGTLYGTTVAGGGSGPKCGDSGCGTVYSITTTGAEKVLSRFSGGSEGAGPYADLIDVNGTLYGTTEIGGAYGKGTVFGIGTGGL